MFEFGKVVVDMRWGRKIYSGKEMMERIIEEIRSGVRLEERELSKGWGR